MVYVCILDVIFVEVNTEVSRTFNCLSCVVIDGVWVHYCSFSVCYAYYLAFLRGLLAQFSPIAGGCLDFSVYFLSHV